MTNGATSLASCIGFRIVGAFSVDQSGILAKRRWFSIESCLQGWKITALTVPATMMIMVGRMIISIQVYSYVCLICF